MIGPAAFRRTGREWRIARSAREVTNGSRAFAP